METPTTDSGPPIEPGLPYSLSSLRYKLGQKAKQEPKFRFYALYDKLSRSDVIEAAYERVRQNGGAPGIDGISTDDIEAGAGGDVAYLKQLRESLRQKRYEPAPIRRVFIPKGDGGQRPLGIPTVRDRIVQMAILLILEPIFETDFEDCSYGFRKGRNAHQALLAIKEHLQDGRDYRYLNLFPSNKALAKQRAAIRAMTGPNRSYVPLPGMIEQINKHLAGWANYFQMGYPRKAFRQVNTYVRQRLTKHLKRRSQRPYNSKGDGSFYAHFERMGLIYL